MKPPAGRSLLAGKVVVVTAAAGAGIGSAVVTRCLDEGASVVLGDSHKRRLGESLDRFAEIYPGRVAATLCDVTAEETVQDLFAAAVRRFGRIDVLVNNAGLGGDQTVTAMTDDEWSRVLDVTLTGTFRCTRAALRQMAAQGGGGAIVNNASVLGWRAQAGQAHYAAAKAGVMAFTRCTALEAASLGVRVNAVAPSLAAHPFLDRVIGADELARLAGREAFGRAAEPWEVATVVAFLASDYASYLTGEVISVSSQRA
ncbi:3-oxoacyl-ACP reductase [Actinoplanes sp. OR16]|uniref:SDR family oxidoreductase n=1 Tax=Actinoplanes sp. OR16 TaxID=946334 RepID=UPI000F6CEE9A|nr:SDR family oxidoreductase [Actinoplanes sp. OR16]BBH67446.1 3-oxoacyl-ACP reductase [Actinoplanes sp. OR16]